MIRMSGINRKHEVVKLITKEQAREKMEEVRRKNENNKKEKVEIKL